MVYSEQLCLSGCVCSHMAASTSVPMCHRVYRLLFIVHTMYVHLSDWSSHTQVWATYWTVVGSFPGFPWGRPGNEAKTVVLTIVLSFSTLEGR